MSQFVKPTSSDQENTSADQAALAQLYEPVADEMQEVENILREEMRSQFPAVDELVRYGCLLGGKRLRPALLLLAGKATGELTRDHLVLAAVLEMIHTATLIHDDVLDHADTRRHLATVNSRWDNEASILLGDFLFSHAFYMASTLETTFACQKIGQATNIVCEGELRQKSRRGDFSLSENEYYEIIRAKTAALCACATQLGAYCSGASPETVRRLHDYGNHLGVAFQIADDLLDLLGDERDTGKTLGTDLEQQISTLPLIHVLQSVDDKARPELISVLSEANGKTRSVLQGYFEQHDAIEYARQKALGFAELAREQLSTLPQSDSLGVLQGITYFVTHRSH